ncbi:SDR family NAD(P)-dependent oxidoreductase [Methylobacter sp. Wu8]|uniref:SDR family NAD(P)-dependent oxidoreductase n=1 Tax=Methylobacter sp. Wu8 TaxID=3118457 RepID=UPI002F2C449C
MIDNLSELFKQCSIEMIKRGQTRFADCFISTGVASTAEHDISRLLQHSAIAPADCLMAASAAGLVPSHQPPAHFFDGISCNQYLLQHLERRGYCIRAAQSDDLPALLLLEERCWAGQLRTPEDVLTQRIARYPQGQLVLTVGDAVVGVIYSQRIDSADALDGIAVAQVDSLHNPEARVVQLLAVNILPDMQQQNLGDQLLEFMLIYRSLQKDVQAVVAITLCKNFDRTAGLALEDYIRQRNEHGVLSDPILRFHELHGAAIQRVMPGYRPHDHKNEGCGVLVSYDIHHRSRNDMRIDAAKNTRFTRSEIRGYLQNALSDCLGEQRKSAFSFDRPLMEMGLDSADLLELNEKIAFRYQLPLTPAFFFQYNTADKIAGYLCEHVVPEQKQDHKREAQQAKCVVTKPQGQASTQDVAIVGMACRLPGGIDTPEEFWRCLQTGASVVGELPAGRWQWPDEIDPAHKHQGIDRGGFLDNVAAFDAPFFRISPAEAESMDPQQRILLELGWQAIEQAGYAPDLLAGSNTGVFIGASGSDYARLLDQSRSPVDAHYGTGNSMAVLANRISYFYDFHGPSLLLDTACSSSLVAVHKAVQSIQTGESSQALVGGINLICHPANSIAYYKAGMLSKDGRCKTFDQQANGYVRSEGAVMLLLKPLASAVSDHDRIYAVIKGTACNHGGQAGGLTVPNPEQQAKLLQTAWQSAKINPRSLGYIEAHGTGTSLGDPIEVQGLKQAFAQSGMQAEKSCGLGSVKTNLGHLEAAAGITGLLKTVLCLQHRQLPASLHFHQLNEHIELSDSCLYVVDRLQPWTPPTDGGPRIAAVSSFGSGGANAHAVLAESPLDVDAVADDVARPLVFVLSAKTRPQLQVYAQKYIDWLSDVSSRSVSMTDLVYTLQTGRQAMEERLALVITDRQDLIGKLAAFCLNQERDAQVYQFNSKTVPAQFRELTEGDAGRAFIRSLVAQRDWDRIALLWLSGVEVDWSLLDGDQAVGGRQPRRIAAPTYPFAKHAYWLPNAELPQERNTAGKAWVEAAVENVLPTVLAPLWRPVIDSKNAGLFPNHDDGVLIIGGSLEQQQAIRSVYTAAQSIAIDPAVTIESLSRQLRQLGNLDHIIWIAPKPDAASEFNETLVEQQNSGLLYVFKLVKALLAQSYGNRDLNWTLITCRTQSVFNEDAPDPAHAGVHGLAGALAKEYPRWSIRTLDMENHLDWPVRELMSLPADRQGDVLACRGGQWFKRFLSPVEKLPESTPVYRQRGVYVVAGGAGGIGEAWTRHVIQHYQAQVIWIGRRRPDAAIQAKLDALADFGPAPVYVVADASSPESLRAAYATIKQRWPVIHGVIHSAVGLFDHSLVEMDEQRFRDILSAKIDISVNLAQVFKYEPLDFMLYFSSVVALEKNGGLSGYAAGGAFEDAFALHLAKQRTCAVKVINWGHWDIGTGDAISAATKIRLQLSGIIPIQPDEAMSVLQGLLTAPVNQLALLKTSRLDVLPMIDPDQNLSIYAETVPQCVDLIPPVSEELNKRVETLKPLSIFNNAELEAQLLPLFADALQSLGLLDESGESPHGFYSQWLEASRKILAEQRLSRGASGNPEQLWQEWEKAKRDSFGNADLTAAIELAEACLRALPDILSGRRRATDILFPDSSMRRVEGIYRNNAVADYFNRILGESLVAAIGIRLQKDPDAQLRILEIGAGAGGTTAMILPLLAPYRQHIAEYAYTDVSKAFLFHAEEQFVKDYPYVRPKLFDVEKPLAGQDIAAQHYDLVIATNVLHATRNIRQTLSNAKAALRKNGLLLLNEISGKSLFAHLTFGLLEGWWLSEDQPLRIPDAPGLYPETWKQVLGQEGFANVLFPAPDAHVLGQQVIVAESDGVVRQQKTAQKPPVNPAPIIQPSSADELPKPAVISSDEGLKEASNFHLKKLAAKTLRMNSHDIDALEPLETYGIDSILVVQITNALREIFPDVRSTLLFECQTIDALSDYFINNNKDELIRLTGLQAQSAASETSRPQVQASAEKNAGCDDTAQLYRSNNKPDAGQDAIAVIGMSCHFPQADNVDDYWQILKSGQDCIREVPADRWPMQDFFDADPDRAVEQGKSYSKWGGFLDNVTDFDPLFFNISPKEAIAIDPQERLFLQTAWETLEDAGYTRERLVNDFKQQVGVFAGITRTGFDLFGPELWGQGSTVYPHTSFSSAANRVSYFLNARGPSVPVDTMCSSSLTAIHQACQSLRSGECRLAIAGGVNIYLHPSGYVGLSASRMLSKDGVCRSFGKGGNGFVPGEGAGAVLLKPLSQAIADNDRIYATIRATHVNHGGKTNGYTVPNPQAQAELVRDALQKAGVDARAVSYIEAHGTGTELGDPIEVSGLTQAFRHTTQDTGFCALGSAKANVGHLEAAAGIAGFIKVILQLRHGQLAPSLHADELNPNIDFDKTPFVVQQTLADWQRPLLEHQGELKEFPRIAGISAFGAGGANAHVIVEEYRQPERLPPDAGQGCVVVLSAKNEERLKTYAGRLNDFIGRRIADGDELELADLAYTLQVGREQMDERLALVAHSLPQLQEKLKAYIGGQDEAEDLYQGQVKRHKELIAAFAGDESMQQTVDAWFRQRKYSRLLNLWTKGMDIDWERLYQGQCVPRRISLPTYPFAATRYWLPLVEAKQTQQKTVDVAPAPLPIPQASAAAVEPMKRTISEVPAQQPCSDSAVPAKPDGVSLREPALCPATFQTQTVIKPISLRSLQSYGSASDTPMAVASAGGNPCIALYDDGDGVFAVKPDNADGQPIAIDSACAGLIGCLQRVNTLAEDKPAHGAVKVLLLTGLDQLFAAEDDPAAKRSISNAASAIAGCVVPVIAVLTGENSYNAMLMAAAGEVMICSSEGTYSFHSTAVSEQEYRLFAERFGKACADKIVSNSGLLSGAALRQAGLTMQVVGQAEIDDYALETARSIAQISGTASAELKKHLSSRTRQLTGNLAAPFTPVAGVPGQADTNRPDAGFVWSPGRATFGAETPEPVKLDSDVVTLKKYRNGVVVVNLCDRSSKNTFSPEFVSGVIEAFEHINNTPGYKAVVLTGYDNYFACGGTKQGLLAIQNGSARFTDEQSYSMPLACEIPVIAAMQGHAIGAGWAMGLFCDWAVYSEESVYQSPYMLYGFTPGAGSTLIFPERLGHDLSREVLLTAREFQGRELKRRGMAMPVMPRREVFDYALALANHLALSTRDQLVRQKNRRSESIRQRLPDVFARELAMHDKTFVGNQDVIDNINRHFNEAAAQDDPAQSPMSGARASSHQSPQQVLESLRQSLAEELQMQREQVDDETAFIDMGLDSITAVTWIRKINKQFGSSIGATKVYSYPTLTRFTEFVLSQMEYTQPSPCIDTVIDSGTVQENGDQLLAWLRETLARELLMSPESLDDDMKFIDMGLDSITAVTWIRAINKRYGLSIGATKVYSYPTLAEFYQYLLKSGSQQGQFQNQEQPQQAVAAAMAAQPRKQVTEPVLVCSFALAGSADRQPVEQEPVTVPPVRAEGAAQSELQQNRNQNSATQSIAIIGMAGQFPKADNVTQFWRNLVQGRECISDIPSTRWSVDEYYDPDRNAPGKTVCKRMGLLDDVDVFDPLFFNISPSEAEYMDPQQRLFLQTSWSCIEDAGYNPSDLSGSSCGVFVGCTVSDYSQLMAGQAQCAQALMGESVSILPARIAYFLNLQGPCLSIDTACSSSLVALAGACDSLVLGHSDLALAGGVYVINGPEIHVKMSKAGMLSPDGRCYSFDQRANGFVPGEGVGVLLLKRLEQAEQDGDDIYGVIRGWGVNQDGKSNGITAPNQESQTRLETGIYKKFGINPEHIQLIEAHGTATKLGDPIEVDALRESFRQFTDRKHFCALGSVKSNIGHLATAAGVSGVIKSVLALQHRQLPPTINYQELNEHIDLEDSPFYVNTQCKPWDAPTGQKRHVAVSSFGFSGTNAHIVLEEPLPQVAAAVAADTPVLLVLSAKSGQQLAVYAQAVSDYLADQYNSREINLSDMAYTFQVGRVALNHRLAVVANTADELRTRLSNYASTGASDQDCVAGEVGKKAAAADGTIQGEATTQQLRQLAERWVVGETVDWSPLYRPGQARRKHGLPTYPFAREHYWIPETEAVEDDTVESKPCRSSETPVIDSELWRGSELPDTIDWQNSLQHYQGKQLAVIYADDGERRAFNNLLMQLKQASGLDDSSNVSYYAVSEINDGLAAKRPDCLLFLGGVGTQPTDTPAIVQCLKMLSGQSGGSPVDIVFFIQADPVAADRLADLISKAVKPEQSRCVLVTQDDCGDLNAAMQRLFREWLAFGAQTEPFSRLSQIHYAAGQRLARNGCAEQVAEHICLINKEWREKQPQPVTHPADRGTVLILVNHESLQIARKLLEPEDFNKVILIGDNSVLPSQIQNSINYKDAESVRISAHILIDQYDNISHIIDLSDLYDTAKDSDADNPGKTVFYQTLIGTYNDIAILYFTKGLQHFQCKQMSLAGAKFAGLVKMLSADYPHVSARFIDIDQTAYDRPGQLRQIIMQEFDAELQETELCYRDGQRFAPVLSAVEAGAGEALPIAQDGVYVISGGTNGVGLEIAKYLAAKGCNKLVLMGITQLPPRESWSKAVNNDGLSPYIKNKLLELIELDKAVEHLHIYTGSLTGQHALKRYFKKIRAKLGPIRGVIHSAGVYSDSDTPGFVSKNLERMKQVWEPKVSGLENLHALFKADAPDFFISFSSMTGLMPHLARGAGDYAMANSFVDFFSAYQHHQNNHTCYKTIIWSDWNQCGAITRIAGERVAAIEENFHRLGIRTFSNQEGRVLFEQAMACTGGSRVFIGYLDRQQFEQVRPQLLYANLNAVEAGKQAVAAKPEAPVETVPENSILHHLDQWEAEKRSGLEVPVYRITDVISLDRIKHLEPNLIHRIHKLLFAGVAQPAAQEQPVDMAQVITNTVLEVLKLKSFDSTQPFQNYGLDSISAMVLATRLEKRLKQPVQPQWLIDFSTVETLSRHLTAQNSKSLLQ